MKRNKRKHPYLTVYRSSQLQYPNAAPSSYFARKALDILTAVVSGVGLITAMVFLVTLT